MPPSWKNVIVKGTAESISLVEGVAYNCPKDFYAKKITFKKNFSMKTGNGEAAGWETIVLPFAATSIKNSSGGILAPFDSDVAGAKNFWLRELTTGGFKDVKAIEANKPYIIAMPNNSNYDSKYNITGDITFEAQNITVKATPNELKSVSGPSFSMSPVYKNLPRANQIYVINEEQEFEGAKPGSVFVRNLRDLKPFAAYITPNGVAPSSLRMIRIDGPVRTKSARTQPRLDLNDNPCSIIKVVTTGEDFQFEGNTIGDPVYRKGEVIVYMTERSRRLTIKHEKYGVIRYEFPQLIGKQEVYELVVKLVEDKNNKLRTLVMPNLSYGSSRLSYGIMIGIVKKTGGYIKMKSDFGSISSEEEVDKNTVDTYWYNGNKQYSRLAITGGLLQRVLTPLYLYVGAGYGYKNVAWQTVEDIWVKNKKISYSGLEAEVGGIYRINNLAISLGMQTNSFKMFEGCLGIGIMF